VTVVVEETVIWPTISLPCESLIEECPRSADGVLRYLCCGTTYALCDEHYALWVKRMKEYARGFRLGFRCRLCVRAFSSKWEPFK
jgi:hypothetical protein